MPKPLADKFTSLRGAMKPVNPPFSWTVTLPLDRILPSRQLKPQVKTSSRYKMIEASVRKSASSSR